MVVIKRTFDLNSLLSSNKVSLLTKEQTSWSRTGINNAEYKLYNPVQRLILGGFACSRQNFWKNFGRTHGRSEKTLLSPGWTLIGSELSSPNFNSVWAEWSFAIHYLNVLIKPLCINLDICLNYYFRSRNSVRMLSVTDLDRKWKMICWIVLLGSALVQFNRFCNRNPLRLQKTRARECT